MPPGSDDRYAEHSRAERVGREGHLEILLNEGERSTLARLLEGQSRVLETIAAGKPLPSVLAELARVIEEQLEDTACSILLLSANRSELRHVAAPSLPERYNRAIGGSTLGPRADPSVRAAFLQEPVIVSDIERDPLWPDHKELLLEAGFKACWASPITSRHGEALGAFGIYHRRPMTATSMHLGLVDLATNLVRIAVERDIAERDRERVRDARRFADRYRMVLGTIGQVVYERDLADDSMQCYG